MKRLLQLIFYKVWFLKYSRTWRSLYWFIELKWWRNCNYNSRAAYFQQSYKTKKQDSNGWPAKTNRKVRWINKRLTQKGFSQGDLVVFACPYSQKRKNTSKSPTITVKYSCSWRRRASVGCKVVVPTEASRCPRRRCPVARAMIRFRHACRKGERDASTILRDWYNLNALADNEDVMTTAPTSLCQFGREFYEDGIMLWMFGMLHGVSLVH